jgi:hypothetical protein
MHRSISLSHIDILFLVLAGLWLAGTLQGGLNDLYSLDPISVTWTRIGDEADWNGSAPPPRCGHGFAYSRGQLFVFGGSGSCFSNPELTGM